jgi:hypothetical protein
VLVKTLDHRSVDTISFHLLWGSDSIEDQVASNSHASSKLTQAMCTSATEGIETQIIFSDGHRLIYSFFFKKKLLLEP